MTAFCLTCLKVSIISADAVRRAGVNVPSTSVEPTNTGIEEKRSVSYMHKYQRARNGASRARVLRPSQIDASWVFQRSFLQLVTRLV